MDSVLNVNRTTKRNLTAVGHERDLCNFIGSFIGKGELFPSAGKFHGFCDSGFPGVRSADNAVQLLIKNDYETIMNRITKENNQL